MDGRLFVVTLVIGAVLLDPALADDGWSIGLPEVVLSGIPVEATVAGPPDEFPVVVTLGGDTLVEASPRVLPGWVAVLPPILAIALALVTRQVLVSLVLGSWIGCLMLEGWNPFAALLRFGDRFLVDALAQPDHASIVLFTTILGGMVGVMARGGLTEGVVHALRRRVGGRRGGQLATAAMGTAIFFDDYANTLLVGTTMRPFTDRLRISREKLAYLVDSTAAPVATVAVISTWVGFEVGLIQDALEGLQRSDGAYEFFLKSLPYSFYPWLTLVCVYALAGTGRDFGPMLRAERRAVTTGAVLRPGSRPASETLGDGGRPPANVGDEDVSEPVNPVMGLLPIVTVILTTAFGLWFDGRRAALAAGADPSNLREVLGRADSFAVLMWAALTGTVVAVVVVVGLRRLDLRSSVDGFVDGCRAMLIAVTILLLAWSLSAVCEELQTAPYLVELCRGALSARLLPAITFVLAAAVSFATGTSWGTMAILMPLVFPLGALLPGLEGLSDATATGIHLASTSAVLAGAVFGDHCSPISDTTIMSSLATGSDHVDHVRTQLPYALTVGAIALVCGYLPIGWGLSPWFALLFGFGLLGAVVWLVAKPVSDRRGREMS